LLATGQTLRAIEAKVAPPSRKCLSAIIDDIDDEATVKKKKEKALAEHVARHPEDVGRTVEDFNLKYESLAGDPENSWLRLRYSIADYRSGEELKIDDKVYLAPTRPHFGGLRWWFVCPHLNRRVRKLYLPLGGHHFWSRRAYELAYASQRETKFDRALRRARKLRLRLGGDPADDEYPDKPPRMRWATYNRLMDRLVAADGVADERLKAARLLWATA
jgi:hypothetical protein